MSIFKHHIFVCTNERPEGHPRGCCKAKDSENLILSLKSEVQSRGLTKEIRVNKSGCLDQCEAGAVMVVYPEATWYQKVNATDAKEIVEGILANEPVSRLVYQKKQG